MDEEVPPARTRGGGREGLHSRPGTRGRGLGMRGGAPVSSAAGVPISSGRAGEVTPQDGESCLVTWPKGNSKSHWESRAHTHHSCGHGG